MKLKLACNKVVTFKREKETAWDNVLRSVFRAAKILGKEITEQDLPDNWGEMGRLHEDLWKQVYRKRGIVLFWCIRA